MITEILQPVGLSNIDHTHPMHEMQLAGCVLLHSKEYGFPNLDGVKLAIFSVQPNLLSQSEVSEDYFQSFRDEFYALFKGNWSFKFADLGILKAGDEISDTIFAVKSICVELLRKDIIPIVLGKDQYLSYAAYRAYDEMEQTVNLCSVDSRFNIGNIEDALSNRNYLSKIIMEEPSNLFNFANLGFQTFYNPQEEIDLLEQLGFEAYRLGQVKDMKIVEPVMRDMDFVSLNLSSVRYSDNPGSVHSGPNGFFGDEICAISRYAGISDKLTMFGLFGFQNQEDIRDQSAALMAQIVWYFFEGYEFRAKDFPFGSKDTYNKFFVPFEDENICFYQSDKSGRWWIEVEKLSLSKFKRHALVPCTYEDYLEACDQNMPERWFKAIKKFV